MFTASPDKYPQGRFKRKSCRWCGVGFDPLAPSHLYCSDSCAIAANSDRYLRTTYGISLADYQSMLERQDFKCAVCGGAGFKMKSEHSVLLVVDHDHKTGRVRGLLCHNCNRGLGLFRDDRTIIEQAIRYLEGATTIPQGSRAKRPEAHGPQPG